MQSDERSVNMNKKTTGKSAYPGIFDPSGDFEIFYLDSQRFEPYKG
jgi:hypothetical protein